MKEIYLKVWMVAAPVVFGVSWYLTDRIRLRIKQLSENSMNVESDQSAWIYAIIVTVIFSIAYFFIARDLSRSSTQSEN